VAQLRPAYLWLIGAREKASPNADVWDLGQNWPQLRQSLKKQITTGTYCFAPLQRTGHATGPAYSWSAQDALVLKALTRGISAGCPLSPLIGAFHLYKLDCLVTQKHPRCFYIRYMDDILILAPSRWQLRRAIATMNGVLEELGLEQHPDKTTIGPVARGFDFLGYTYSPAGLGLAQKTIRNHRIKLHRLYEHYLRARKGALRAQIVAAITTYIARWTCWATGELHGTFQLDLAGALRA
jgi:hypothetical protein